MKYPPNILSKSNNAYHNFFSFCFCLKPWITCASISASSLLNPVILLATQVSNLYPPLAPRTDTSSTSVGIHFLPCYVWKIKKLRKARTQLMKHLLKHLQLDRADAATTTKPHGRLNSILGKREGMGECYASLRELPQKLTVFFLLMENTFFFFLLLCFLH